MLLPEERTLLLPVLLEEEVVLPEERTVLPRDTSPPVTEREELWTELLRVAGRALRLAELIPETELLLRDTELLRATLLLEELPPKADAEAFLRAMLWWPLFSGPFI